MEHLLFLDTLVFEHHTPCEPIHITFVIHNTSLLEIESRDSSMPEDTFAEIRSYIAGEFSRMKDDVSDIYDKMNALKDATTADRIQLIAQFNQEYQAFNNRLNNFAAVMQQLVSDAEHTGSAHAAELKQIFTEVDNKLLRCKLDLKDVDHTPDIEVLKQRVTALEAKHSHGVPREDFDSLKKSVAVLSKNESATRSKVQKLSLKIGFVIAVLMYLVDKFVVPIIRSGIVSSFSKPASVYETVVVDTVVESVNATRSKLPVVENRHAATATAPVDATTSAVVRHSTVPAVQSPNP